jgi:hypothetical protein
MDDFTHQELRVLRRLNTPHKIQDFLDSLPMNFSDVTCYSPRMVLRHRKAHCMEGAMFAAAALRIHGQRPLVMDLKSGPEDDDHAVAVFLKNGFWGAISKTNHGVLRYREPVYQSIRELAMSYFHEYFLQDGRKTLRSYSQPMDLSRFDGADWMTSEKSLEYISEALDRVRHFRVLRPSQIRGLRRADLIERKMGSIREWTKTSNRKRARAS